jgi:hypothetical protein
MKVWRSLNYSLNSGMGKMGCESNDVEKDTATITKNPEPSDPYK